MAPTIRDSTIVEEDIGCVQQTTVIGAPYNKKNREQKTENKGLRTIKGTGNR